MQLTYEVELDYGDDGPEEGEASPTATEWSLDPTMVEYAEVDWGGRRIVMTRRAPETTWRIRLGLG